MGFMDGLKKLTQPYDDEEDFFEGADQSLRPQPKPEQKQAVSAAQMAFENAFADPGGTPAPAGAHRQLWRKGHLRHSLQPQDL